MEQALQHTAKTQAPPQTSLTASAAKRINQIASKTHNKGKMLRVKVSGGGCKGFSYGFSFDDKVGKQDKVFECHGAKLLVDEASLNLLKGSVIDFVEEVMGAHFAVRNPNATSSCGCGLSFDLA